MSQSFDLLIDGMIEAIRSRILPQLSDDFVRVLVRRTISFGKPPRGK